MVVKDTSDQSADGSGGLKMTVYRTEADYIKDQLSSYRTAKKELKKLITMHVENYPPDFRGDREKILSALNASVGFIDAERREFYEENKHHLSVK